MQAIEMSARRGEVRWEWIGEAWKMFSQNPVTWIGMMLVSVVVGGLVIGLPFALFILPTLFASSGGGEISGAGIAAVAGSAILALFAVLIVGLLVGSFMLTGFYKTAIKQVRGEPISVGDLFSGTDSFLRVLGFTFLISLAGIAILIAFMILSSIAEEFAILGQLVQSGVSLVLQGLLFFSIPLIIDKNMGIIEAIQTSIQATKSNWWMYLLFLIVMSIIMGVSMIPCGLGLFVTVPMYFLAPALAYRDIFLSSNSSDFDKYSSAPPSPNYYTPQPQFSNPPQPQFSAPPQQFAPPAPPQQFAPPAPPQPYSPPPAPQFPPVMSTQQYTPPPPPATPPPAPGLHSQETQLMGKNCPNCGVALTRVSNFCNQCGSPIKMS